MKMTPKIFILTLIYFITISVVMMDAYFKRVELENQLSTTVESYERVLDSAVAYQELLEYAIDEKDLLIDTQMEVIEMLEETAYVVTPEERELLARILFLEAGIENFESRLGVLTVIMNRVAEPRFPNTIKGVIFDEGQFEPAHMVPTTTPRQQEYDTVDYFLKHGGNLPSYVMYFRADYHFSGKNWDPYGYTPYIIHDGHYFGYFRNDYLRATGQWNN